jgi:hypothetical protein
MEKLSIKSITVLLVLLSGLTQITAQETETLLTPGSDVKFIWGTEFKTSSIKSDLGTSHGFFGGALIGRSTLLGISLGFNLTHPKLNHGYLGILVQYTHKPNNLVHFSGQLLVASASARGYQQRKTNIFDNLGNITGSSFYIIEPGLNIELNFTEDTRLIFGLSYRHATGLGNLTFEQWDNNRYNSTRYTYNDNDLSGFQFNIGVKFGDF